MINGKSTLRQPVVLPIAAQTTNMTSGGSKSVKDQSLQSLCDRVCSTSSNMLVPTVASAAAEATVDLTSGSINQRDCCSILSTTKIANITCSPCVRVSSAPPRSRHLVADHNAVIVIHAVGYRAVASQRRKASVEHSKPQQFAFSLLRSWGTSPAHASASFQRGPRSTQRAPHVCRSSMYTHAGMRLTPSNMQPSGLVQLSVQIKRMPAHTRSSVLVT